MDTIYNELIVSIIGMGLTGLGLGIRYMIRKLQEIVPRAEISEMISTQLEKADLKDESIMSRLSRMEQQLDTLVEHLLKDGAPDGHQK